MQGVAESARGTSGARVGDPEASARAWGACAASPWQRADAWRHGPGPADPESPLTHQEAGIFNADMQKRNQGNTREDGQGRGDSEHGVLPLAVAMRQCVLRPVLLQYEQVSSRVLQLVLKELHLERHLRALRRYFFAEDGLWARGLAKRLFCEGDDLIGQGHLRSLPFVLQEALVESGLHSDPLAKRLALQHAQEDEARGVAATQRASAAPSAFSSVNLTYHVDYPLDIIIHADAQAHYQRVLGFILDIHRAIDALQDCWLILKELSARDEAKLLSSVLAAAHSLRHHMVHFVGVLHGYLLSQLLHTSWAELLRDLRPCHSSQAGSPHGDGEPVAGADEGEQHASRGPAGKAARPSEDSQNGRRPRDLEEVGPGDSIACLLSSSRCPSLVSSLLHSVPVKGSYRSAVAAAAAVLPARLPARHCRRRRRMPTFLACYTPLKAFVLPRSVAVSCARGTTPTWLPSRIVHFSAHARPRSWKSFGKLCGAFCI